MKRTLRFTQERLTKHTVRFQEELASEADTPTIGTLYVQKSVFAGKLPDAVTVTVEWEE